MKKNWLYSFLVKILKAVLRIFSIGVNGAARLYSDVILEKTSKLSWTSRLELVETLMKRILSKVSALPKGDSPFTEVELVQRTEDFNKAAEDYFQLEKNRIFVSNKPFSDRLMFGQRLFDLGLIVHWLRLSPGETVLDFGAGTSWISHFLNRFGCPTIALDVSATALEFGRKMFEDDPQTNWNLNPEFMPYNGHHIPLNDQCIDKIVVYDAFHHIPNQEEILKELHRIMKTSGVMAMCEPGRFHASTGASQRDMSETGVLENSIILEDINKLAKACGFEEITVVPTNLQKTIEVKVEKLDAFLAGERFVEYWSGLRNGLIDMNCLLFYKEKYVPTTRRPGYLSAVMIPEKNLTEMSVSIGEKARLWIQIKNTGDTRWLKHTPERAGKTQLGAHLYRKDFEGPAVNFDWYRHELPTDVDPDSEISLEIELPSIQEVGEYRVVFDLVAEHIAWFQEFGSLPLDILLKVGST